MDINILTDLLTQLLNAKPEILLGVGLIVLGYILKTVPSFPNKLIPLVIMLAGMIVYPMMTSPGAAPPDMRYPVVRDVLRGLIISFVAHYAHALLLKRLLDKFLPLQIQQNGDTKFVVKDPPAPDH